MRAQVVAMIAAALTASCSSVLGFKDPQVETDPQDAMIGGPGNDTGVVIDASMMADGSIIDGKMIDAPIDGPKLDGASGCPSTCGFGCDTGTTTCRTGKLYVYETVGAFVGNDFGGQDVPPTVRATADNLCFETVSTMHQERACSRDRTHAILGINGPDSVSGMAVNYSIPLTVGVDRVDDDVLVANNWNDLVDITMASRAPVTTATGDSALVWTGASASVNAGTTCQGWTAADKNSSGVTGHTDMSSLPMWLGHGASPCNTVAHLLCICWAGGN
jgi:hypothetical protein